MPGIMADNDVGGQLETLIQCLQSETWREIWAGLHITLQTFETLGLLRNVSDVLLWEACQQREVVLVTANRNDEGSESLESAIRNRNTSHSLPVFTLADPTRITTDKRYAEQVAERLSEYLFDLDMYRGAGRLWLP